MKEISAGGVVYRKDGNVVQIQMIRDRYGKMTLPKGKMEPNETAEQTALREIREETGIEGRIVAPLGTVSYRYAHPEGGTVDKEVRYFLVEATGGSLRAQTEEISGVEWMSPQLAWRQQTAHGYPNNEAVLKKALHALNVGVD